MTYVAAATSSDFSFDDRGSELDYAAFGIEVKRRECKKKVARIIFGLALIASAIALPKILNQTHLPREPYPEITNALTDGLLVESFALPIGFSLIRIHERLCSRSKTAKIALSVLLLLGAAILANYLANRSDYLSGLMVPTYFMGGALCFFVINYSDIRDGIKRCCRDPRKPEI